jgi:hypothetical protein
MYDYCKIYIKNTEILTLYLMFYLGKDYIEEKKCFLISIFFIEFDNEF